MSLYSQLPPGFRLKAIGEFEQLVFEVIDRKAPVVERAVFCQRIDRIVEGRTHAPGDVEAAGRPHHADRIEPVGILEDLCLQRFRHKIG